MQIYKLNLSNFINFTLNAFERRSIWGAQLGRDYPGIKLPFTPNMIIGFRGIFGGLLGRQLLSG
jgi:hypothetical protein